MRKPLLKIVLSLFAFLLAFVIFLPMLISISKVNQFILSCVNSHIPGKLYAQEVRVGWTDGLYVRDLVVHDPEGRNVASFKKISCDVSLLSLLNMPEIVGKIEVVSPKIALVDNEKNGHFSIERVFAESKDSPAITNPQATQEPDLLLSDLHFHLDIQPQGKAEIDLTCTIENRGAQNGQIAMKATAKNFQELEKAYTNALSRTTGGPAADVVVDCAIDHLPVKAIIPFLNITNPEIAPLIIPSIGESLNGHIQHSFQGDELSLSLSLASQTLATSLNLQLEGSKLQIGEQGSIRWKIRPELFEQIKKLLPQKMVENLVQQQSVTLLATIAPQSGRLDSDGKMPLAISWGLDSPFILKNPAWPSPLALNLQGDIATNALQEQLNVQANLDLTTGKEKANLRFNADITHPLKNPKTSLSCHVAGPLAEMASKFIPETPLPLEALIGKVCTIDTTFQADEKQQSGTLTVSSETLNGKLTFSKEKNQPLNIATTAKLALTQLSSRYKELAGSELTLNAVCPVTLSDEAISIHDFEAKIASSTLQVNVAKLECTLFPKVEIETKAPITFHYLLTKSAFSALSPESKLILREDIALKGAIESSSKGEILKGHLEAPSIDLGLANEPLANFKLTLPFELEIATKKAQGKLQLSSEQALLESAFSLMLQEPSIYKLLPQISAHLEGTMKEFPVKILSTISNKPQLETLLGPKLHGSWNFGIDNALTEQPFTLSLKGQGLAVETNFKLGKELACQGRGDCIKVDWQITPERLSALQEIFALAQSEKQKELRLQKPFAIQATVNSCKLPIGSLLEEGKSPQMGELLDALELESVLSVSEITLASKQGQPLQIAPLKGSVEVKGKERKVTFAANSEKSNNPKAALFSLNGDAKNLWNESGIDVEKAKIVLDIKIQNLPLDIFHSITAKPETADKLVAVLGTKIDANLKGEIKELNEGSFQGQIESPMLKSEVALLLKKGTLLLEKPLTAEYTLTPEAGEVLLKDVNPLLVTAARSQSPIKLWIDSKDFFIPLKPFSKKEMMIRNIKIEPGVLTCKNGGMLSLLVTLLKVNTSSSNEVNLWFTPMYVDVKNGIVTCKRTDALFADAFPIATWGKIDLEKDKVDMTLGLSGTAISRAFDIPTIDPEYLVQIPIHGPTQSPKIDTGRATAKITALKMQQHSSNTTALLGGLLEVATSVGERDEPPPVPTTYPFPWTSQLQETKKHKRR